MIFINLMKFSCQFVPDRLIAEPVKIVNKQLSEGNVNVRIHVGVRSAVMRDSRLRRKSGGKHSNVLEYGLAGIWKVCFMHASEVTLLFRYIQKIKLSWFSGSRVVMSLYISLYFFYCMFMVSE